MPLGRQENAQPHETCCQKNISISYGLQRTHLLLLWPLHRSSSSKAMSFLTVSPHSSSSGGSSSASSLSSGQGGLGENPNASPPSPPPALVAMFCFEDAIQPGVALAVKALRSGSWRSAGSPKDGDGKNVVMLTGVYWLGLRWCACLRILVLAVRRYESAISHLSQPFFKRFTPSLLGCR